MEHHSKISVISFQIPKNRKALYIQCSQGNDLREYRNFGVLPRFEKKFWWRFCRNGFITKSRYQPSRRHG